MIFSITDLVWAVYLLGDFSISERAGEVYLALKRQAYHTAFRSLRY